MVVVGLPHDKQPPRKLQHTQSPRGETLERPSGRRASLGKAHVLYLRGSSSWWSAAIMTGGANQRVPAVVMRGVVLRVDHKLGRFQLWGWKVAFPRVTVTCTVKVSLNLKIWSVMFGLVAFLFLWVRA